MPVNTCTHRCNMNALNRAPRRISVGQAAFILLVATLTPVFLCGQHASAALVGGWTKQEPSGNPKYLSLAHYAVSQQTQGRDKYDTVSNLTEVYTQVVAGVNYKLTFTTAPSNCTVGQDAYSAQLCVPVAEVNGRCTAVVYEVPWANTTGLTSYTCSPVS
uniref:Cystatin domain-containing protein n=1 Tax=Amblyomma maculatum TaxID=34609 RepID=G3MTA4_AMBMU